MFLASRKYVGALVASVLSGVLLAAAVPGAFGRVGWGFLAPLALFPLFLGMELLPTQSTPNLKPYMRVSRMTRLGRGSIAFGLTWLMGATFYAAAFSWALLPALRVFGWNYPMVSGGYFVSSLVCGLYFPLVLSPFILNAARGVCKGSIPLPVWAMVMASVAIELCVPRLWPWTFGSFVSSATSFDQWISIFGASALSPLVLGTSAYLAAAFGSLGGVIARLLSTAGALVFAWLVVWGCGAWRHEVLSASSAQLRRTRIVAIQPKFLGPTRARIEEFPKEASVEKLLAFSQESFSQVPPEKKPELVVWPAGVFPEDFLDQNEFLKSIFAFTAKNDVPILLQTFEGETASASGDAGDSTSVGVNSAFLARPGAARSDSYRQGTLMPFVERLPFFNSFSFAQDYFDSVLKRRRIEAKPTVLAISYTPDFKLSPLIGHDVTDSSLVRKLVSSAEAGLLVHITNGVLFKDTGAVYLLDRMLQIRAIESGRSVVAASNVDEPVAFDPLGRRLDAFAQGPNWKLFDLPVFDAETARFSFFVNFGNVPFGIIACLAFFTLFLSSLRRPR
jgi:apolipoprotein N-acyltransferase